MNNDNKCNCNNPNDKPMPEPYQNPYFMRDQAERKPVTYFHPGKGIMDDDMQAWEKRDW